MRIALLYCVCVTLLAGTASAAPILFDFGDADAAVTGWNIVNVDVWPVVAQVVDAQDATGAPTAVDLDVSGFRGHNGSGSTASTVYPAFATSDSAFGSTGAHGGIATPVATVLLSDLDVNLDYVFTFYGSRSGVSDNRETQYEVVGLNTEVALLDAANNVDNTVTTLAVTPDPLGQIQVNVSAGPNNTNSLHYYYLGVMEVEAVPEPATVALLSFGGILALIRRRK